MALERVKKERSIHSIIFSTIGTLVALALIWYARTLCLLVFASILFALLLYSISTFVSRATRLGRRLSLFVTLLVILGLLILFFWVASPLIVNQMAELKRKIPAALDELKKLLGTHADLHSLSLSSLADRFIFKNEKFLEQATALFSVTFEAIGGFLFFLFVSICLAFDPWLYLTGFFSIFSPRRRAEAEGLVYSMGHALRWWLVGKCISMAAIGILTTLGLWILHVPLAFILGLLAALLAFIPYIGSIIASIPAILVGFSVSPIMGLYVIILYLVIHAIEGYFITPIIEQKTVFLPPALTVTVQLVLAMLVGFLGLALASPFTVVLLAWMGYFSQTRKG